MILDFRCPVFWSSLYKEPAIQMLLKLIAEFWGFSYFSMQPLYRRLSVQWGSKYQTIILWNHLNYGPLNDDQNTRLVCNSDPHCITKFSIRQLKFMEWLNPLNNGHN